MEFAIALPFLVMVVFGVADGARALFVWIDMKNAAREGAMYGQTHPYRWARDGDGLPTGVCDDGNTITDHAEAETDASVTVTVTYAGGSTFGADQCRAPTGIDPIPPGTNLHVRVETPFNGVTPIVDRFFDHVSATVTVRVQG